MLNTSNTYSDLDWLSQQEALIASLQSQPLIVVLRPDIEDFNLSGSQNPLFTLIENLCCEGIKHIEIAWSSHPSWMPLMQALSSDFNDIALGAASVTNHMALECVAALQLGYAMTPTWDRSLQIYARSLKQLLVPGVFSLTEIKEAKSFGCKLIKLIQINIIKKKNLEMRQLVLGWFLVAIVV